MPYGADGLVGRLRHQSCGRGLSFAGVVVRRIEPSRPDRLLSVRFVRGAHPASTSSDFHHGRCPRSRASTERLRCILCTQKTMCPPGRPRLKAILASKMFLKYYLRNNLLPPMAFEPNGTCVIAIHIGCEGIVQSPE